MICITDSPDRRDFFCPPWKLLRALYRSRSKVELSENCEEEEEEEEEDGKELYRSWDVKKHLRQMSREKLEKRRWRRQKIAFTTGLWAATLSLDQSR